MTASTILYIHGMGGGADSRIPSILRECLGPKGMKVVVRTYDFDPEIAQAQISAWIEELRPVELVGESMGATHALAMGRRYSLPVVLVSPALNVGAAFSSLAWLTLIPGVTKYLDTHYHPRPGDRQKLHFAYSKLIKWGKIRREAIARERGAEAPVFAFFGTRDNFRRSGIVSLHTWRRIFGDATYAEYDGIHFMEEQYVRTILVDKIYGML